MINAVLSLYSPKYIKALVYLLQTSKYDPKAYLKLYWKTQDFSKIESKNIKANPTANLFWQVLVVGIVLEILLGIALILYGIAISFMGDVYFGIAALLGYPIVWAHVGILPLALKKSPATSPKKP